MAVRAFTSSLTVAQVLRGAPAEVLAVFTRRKTACVGCPLARFCTLADVAATYDIPQAELLDELRRTARTHPASIGAQHA